MTNKNKRTKDPAKVAKREAARAEALAKTAKPPPVELEKPGILNKGQLIALIFLSMGISRLLQVGSAMRKETLLQVASDDEEQKFLPQLVASNSCVSFFNNTGDGELWTPESTCLDDGFNSLLKYKFAMGWQVTGVVLALVLQCWHLDEWLLRFQAGLTVTPLLVSVICVLSVANALVDNSRALSQVLMASVLIYIGSPVSKDWVPFLGSRLPPTVPKRNAAKSLQSLVLVTTACLFFFQAVHQLAIPLLPNVVNLYKAQDVLAATAPVLSWVNSDIIATVTNTPSSLIPLLLIMVDKLTLSYVNFFAWFYLPERQQRTFLLYTGLIYFGVATIQWDWLVDHVANPMQLQMMDSTVAGFALLAWFTPTIEWKKLKAE